MGLLVSDMPLPIRFRPETPMSDEALLHFCEANESLRVEREANGEIVLMTPAATKTSKMNLRIGRLLDEWAESSGHGVATGPDGGYTLPDGSMKAPDAAWVALDRWEMLPAESQGFLSLCPNFVIELRSPSDGLAQMETKMEMWIANGAQVGWLIDPERRVVTIYRQGRPAEVLEQPEVVPGDGPIAGFELEMARVWS